MAKTILSILRSHTRIGLLLFACVAFLKVNASGWQVINHPDDPMKNKYGFVEHVYTDDNGNMLSWSEDNPNEFMIVSPYHVFLVKDNFCIGHAGYYDENGVYDSKWPIMLCPGNQYNHLFSANCFDIPTNQKQIIKMLNYLREEKGFVRLIFKLYDDTEFDLMIPCESRP